MKRPPAGALLTAALLCACAVPLTTAAAAEKPAPVAAAENLAGQRYVAIGSSFAAGPQLPPAKPSWPARCGQSFSNYPTLLAARFGMELIDRSCSGATTDHVLGPWAEVPPQINSVTRDTRLVTITIGGNDLSYIGNLFSATCAFNARVIATQGSKGRACGPVYVPSEADYVRDEAQLNEIARRIRTTAPQARIVFVQYLTPLPAPGKLCAVTPVNEADAATVREIGRRLSEITARVAQAHGAMLARMDVASASHTPCDEEPWMIGSPEGYDGRQGLQWHLNRAGMEATAESVATLLIESGVRPVKTPTPAEATPAGTPVPLRLVPKPLPAPTISVPPPVGKPNRTPTPQPANGKRS